MVHRFTKRASFLLFPRKYFSGLVGLMAFLLAIKSNAQYENIWALGDRKEHASIGLNFTTTPPSPISTQLLGHEASASICDVGGNLLFYTNGDVVWDRNHAPMPNGSALTGIFVFSDTTPCISTTQGALIAPVPGSHSRYYVFSLTASADFLPDSLQGRLYYSVVDMELNGGMGDIVSRTKGVLLDTLLSEKMTAVVGNHCNIWLIVHKAAPSNVFHSWEITSAGLAQNPVISGVGSLQNVDVGWLTPAPDGTGLVLANNGTDASNGGLEHFEFNFVTGSVTNPMLLDSNQQHGYYGTAFSADGTKVYASSVDPGRLWQFDLNNISPPTSKKLIGPCKAPTAVRLGPDGKIYTRDTAPGFSVVMSPSLSGDACEYTTGVVTFAPEVLTGIGLPNMIPVLAADTVFSFANIKVADCFAEAATIWARDTIGWDYLWSTGTRRKELVIDTPGLYWVTYHTSPCTYHVDSFRVGFSNVLPKIITKSACNNDPNGSAFATIDNGDSQDYRYAWVQGVDTLSLSDSLVHVPSGRYLLHVWTEAGCDTSLFFEIPETYFELSFSVSDTLLCIGDSLNVTNTSDRQFRIFHWIFDVGDTFVVEAPPTYSYSKKGTYRLMLAAEGEECIDTVYQTIIVDQPFFPDLQVEPKAVCVGQPVFIYSKTDSTVIQMEWELDGQTLHIEENFQSHFQHNFNAPGIYPINLRVHSRACSDTGYADNVQVYALPEVDLGKDTAMCLQSGPIYLNNLRDAPLSPYQQVWSTGDTTDILKVVHPGIYTLSVTTEPIGCSTTESIEIGKDCYIDIPNAFSPNGDGYNDYFFPRRLLGDGFGRFKMQVFNRWGQIIFETSSPDGPGWDGRYNDKPQPMGVYLYLIDIAFESNRWERYHGNITLIR